MSIFLRTLGSYKWISFKRILYFARTTSRRPDIPLAAEGLSVLFYRASMRNIFRGLQSVSGPFLSHLQYKDDTLVFISIDIDHLLQVKIIMRWFALSSCLHINFYKSSNIGINVEDHLCLSLARIIF